MTQLQAYLFCNINIDCERLLLEIFECNLHFKAYSLRKFSKKKITRMKLQLESTTSDVTLDCFLRYAIDLSHSKKARQNLKNFKIFLIPFFLLFISS